MVEKPQDVATLTVRNPNDLAFVTQTKLSLDDTRRILDALKVRFPNISGLKEGPD